MGGDVLNRFVWLVLGTVWSMGCLDDPELKSCIEFPLNTEGCNTGCDLYCEEMVARCPDVYATSGVCMNDCLNEPVTDFTEGDFGDTTGNSLSCRLTFLLQGECTEASLRDSTQCIGVRCADYCATMETNCPEAYPNQTYCEEVCADLPRGDNADGLNTIECRFKYAEMTTSAVDACNAAGLTGGGVCGSKCEPYCSLVMANCTGDNAVYADLAECMTICALLPQEGNHNDWDFDIEADSLDCRTYHAGPPAAADPVTHCGHTRVYNEEHCGITPGATIEVDWPCNTFCDIVLAQCASSYSNEAECLADCATLDAVTNPDAQAGPQLYPVSTLECPVP